MVKALQKRKPSTGAQRGEVDLKEIENAEKQLESAQTEYQRLNARMEQVSNPQYILELKERILAMDGRMKRLGKNQKRLEVDQFHREKKINRVIEVGESEMFQDIQKAKTEYTIAETRILELDGTLERGAETVQDHSKKMSELSALMKKLVAEATELGLDPAVAMRQRDRVNPTEERFHRLQQAKDGLVKETTLIRTRHHVSLSDFLRKKSTLQKQLSVVAEKVQAKNELVENAHPNSVWINHMQEMTDLADKLKGPYSDMVEAALKRWESMKAREVILPPGKAGTEVLRSIEADSVTPLYSYFPRFASILVGGAEGGATEG